MTCQININHQCYQEQTQDGHVYKEQLGKFTREASCIGVRLHSSQ